jgi:zinc/manganese transport system substrate-binding protein
MKKLCLFLLIFLLISVGVESLSAKDMIRVITTLPDLASLATAVGGDRVQVEALVKGTQDPHSIEVLPSYMVKLRKADIFLIIGMDLDVWAYPLRDGSRNAKLLTVDCSKNIEKLEVPSYKVDPSYGDIHLYGNPHYWLDPANGKAIMATIVDALSQVSPEYHNEFEGNMQAYDRKLDEKMKEWEAEMSPYLDAPAIFYHNSWPYFVQRFGLRVVDFVEPKPGIPPSPSHITKLIQQVKEQGVKVIAMEPFYDDRVPKLISRETGAKVVTVAPSVGGNNTIQDYIGLFDFDVRVLTESLKE